MGVTLVVPKLEEIYQEQYQFLLVTFIPYILKRKSPDESDIAMWKSFRYKFKKQLICGKVFKNNKTKQLNFSLTRQVLLKLNFLFSYFSAM